MDLRYNFSCIRFPIWSRWLCISKSAALIRQLKSNETCTKIGDRHKPNHSDYLLRVRGLASRSDIQPVRGQPFNPGWVLMRKERTGGGIQRGDPKHVGFA